MDWSIEWNDGRWVVVVGWAVPAALMRPVIVEVLGVLVEDCRGVAFVVDEDSVGALGPDAAHEPFWRASQIPDTGPNKVRPGTEDDLCENGVGSSRPSSKTRP